MPRIGLSELERMKMAKAGADSISCQHGWRPIDTAPTEGEALVWDGKEVWFVEIGPNKFWPKQNGCGCCSEPIHAILWQPSPHPPLKESE